MESEFEDIIDVEELQARYVPKLQRMVEFRLDRRLQGRIDPADVIQESWLEIVRRLPEFRQQEKISFLLWMRLIVRQKILSLQRYHLGAHQRDIRQEVSLFQGGLPPASSAALAARLLGSFTSPSEAVARAERIQRLEVALNKMDEIDREVLVLRHFEDLNREESAQELGISIDAVSKRYVRALSRLKKLLSHENFKG